MKSGTSKNSPGFPGAAIQISVRRSEVTLEAEAAGYRVGTARYIFVHNFRPDHEARNERVVSTGSDLEDSVPNWSR